MSTETEAMSECVCEREAHTLVNNTLHKCLCIFVCTLACEHVWRVKGVVVVVMAGGTLVTQVWKEERENQLFCVITT